MAFSIVADSASASKSLPGIEQSSFWYCDVYQGDLQTLIAVGLMSADQLQPQKGRSPGYTAFLPNGQPCPAKQKAWREPGYKAIRQQEDGTFKIFVTVDEDTKVTRRKVEKAAKYEAEQQCINEAVAKNGSQYSNWKLTQEFHGWAETWEGTKAQFQAAGLGVGCRFPGEPGATQELRTTCSLGFEFTISIPSYEMLKAAAGIYIARSWYDPRPDAPKQFVAHAPGVRRQVWVLEDSPDDDHYYGTAQALVDAGIVPGQQYFPGQPGGNRIQTTYLRDWQECTTSRCRREITTISKRGNSGQFMVEVPVDKAEVERREALNKERERERNANLVRLSAERKELRLGAIQNQKSDAEFRATRGKLAERLVTYLWQEVFCKNDGLLSFDIPRDGELWETLGEAFQTIYEVVEEADIQIDKKAQAAAQARMNLAAARNDRGLQSVLQGAKGLRLIDSNKEAP